MDRLNRLHIQDPWYTEILAGRKDVEGRTGPADKFAGWAGKPVLVTNGKHSAVLVVAAVRHYPDLASYLEGEGWGRVAPHTGSTQGAADAYHDITMKGGVQVFGDARVAARGGMCAVELGGLRRRFTNENGVEVTTEVGPAEQKEGGPPGVRIAIGCSKSESEWVVTPGEAAALQRQLAAFLVK